MMSRKRDKPYTSRHVPYSFPKRRRPLPPPHPSSHSATSDDCHQNSAAKSPSTVVAIGLSPNCSLLDIKSRFQIYGSISRTTIHHGGVAYITFRSKSSAESAIAASLDPSFGITLDSNKVQVTWATDDVPQHKDSTDSFSSSSSKLVRAEVPLSRHGRGNKLGSALVNPRSNNSDSGLDVSFKDSSRMVSHGVVQTTLAWTMPRVRISAALSEEDGSGRPTFLTFVRGVYLFSRFLIAVVILQHLQ
ncbi:unnamed protein product [Camellia sinensis]